MTEVIIGASRKTLPGFAQRLLDATEGDGSVDITLYGKANIGGDYDVDLQFSNDDMEDRTDIDADAVLVDIDND